MWAVEVAADYLAPRYRDYIAEGYRVRFDGRPLPIVDLFESKPDKPAMPVRLSANFSTSSILSKVEACGT